MRKNFILVILSVVINSSAFAQDKGYIALSLGPSFPMSDFASNDLDNEKAGLAGVGTVTNFSFAYRFGKSLGIASMISWQSNPLDVEPLLTDARALNPTITWAATSENWKLSGFLAGLYGTYPISNSTTLFEFRTMIGLMSAGLPAYSVSGTYGGITLISKVNSQSTGTIAFLLGVGFRFNVGKKVSLLTNLDYSSATAKFLHVSNTSNFGSSRNFDITQEMRTLNFGFGIGLRL